MNQSETQRIIEDAWLDIDIPKGKLINPFEVESSQDLHMKLTWLMMQPEYFSFICKVTLSFSMPTFFGGSSLPIIETIAFKKLSLFQSV